MDENVNEALESAHDALVEKSAELHREAESLMGRVMALAARARTLSRQAVEGASDAGLRVEKSAQKYYGEATELVEREPLVSAVAAFGIGCAIGFVIYAFSHKSSEARPIRSRAWHR